MILDTLANANRYYSFHPLFPRALEFLAAPDLMTAPPGRIEIAGPDLVAIISTQQGKWHSEARLETHRKFIDIHYLLAGKETMGWRAGSECRETEVEYSAEKDIAFFTDEPSLWITMHPGTFTVFFPWDGHAPLVGNGSIHKVVLKVAL